MPPRLRSRLRLLVAGCSRRIYWKSPYSAVLIDTWNDFVPITIGRTVDWTDLIALLMLPISYVYAGGCPRVGANRRTASYPVCIVSILAFAATSFRHEERYTDIYSFTATKAELIKRIERLHSLDSSGLALSPEDRPDRLEIDFHDCTDTATITVKGEKDQTVIALEELIWRCPDADLEKMRRFFEKEFTDKLREPEPLNLK